MAIIGHGIISQSGSVNATESYRIRYIELIRAIAGAFLGCILYLLTCTTTLTDSPLLLVSSTLANLIGWILGEQITHRFCLYFNGYTATKSQNPLYRNFKTLASLGVSCGALFAMVWSFGDIKLSASIYSASFGFVLGLFAFAFRFYRQSMPVVSEDKKNVYARLGTEGWSKYTKLALTVGTSIGQGVGGYLSYVGGYDTISSWTTITLYGAIAAIISFFSVAILVPIVNYLTRNEKDKGILVIENKEVFNSNYIRTGMTLGVAIGTILGGVFGPVIFAGLSVAVSIAVSTAVCSILCGVILGIYGYDLSLYFQSSWGVPVTTDNSWSYASRTTSYVFGFIGTVVACLLCPGVALLNSAAVGAAISGLVGWFVGLGIMWKARQLEPNEEKATIPWTQRISAGATRGSTLGAFLGLILALCFGGSLSLIGLITLFSALGGIIGAINDGVDDPIAKRLIGKAFFDDSTITKSIESNKMSGQLLNHPAVDSSIISINNRGITPKGTSSSADFDLRYFLDSTLLFFSSNHLNQEQEILDAEVTCVGYELK